MAKKLVKSFGYKAVHLIVLVLYSVLLVPILLRFWDLEVYGAWIALYALFNLIQVFEVGHGTFVGNEFNRVVNTDVDEGKRILGSALRANFLIGFLQLGVVYILYVTHFLDKFLDKGVDAKTVTIVLFILFVYRMIIGSFRGIIVKILNPFGLIYKSFVFALTEKILEFGILAVAAVGEVSLIYLAWLWLIVKFIYSVIVLFQLKKILPDYYPWWKYGDFKLGFVNFKKSIPFFASNFLDRLGNDGIVLVVSVIMGSTFLPLFAATRTIVNFGLKLSDFFLNPIDPEMINLYAQNKKKQLLEIFKSYWLVTGIILTVGFTASLFFIEHLFNLWTGKNLEFNLLLYSALVIIFLIQNYGKVLYTFFNGINHTRAVFYSTFLKVVLFFIVVYVLRDYGLYAVLIGLLFSELFISSILLPYFSFKIFNLTSKQKLLFFINLFSVLFLGWVYYLNIYGNNTIWISLSFIPVLTLLYIQYADISIETKQMVFKRIGKLTTFARKK